MNPHEFVPLMGSLAAATGHKPLGADGIEVWRRHLADIPDDVLRKAFSRACCECQAFPSVALIREFAADAQHGETRTQSDVWGRLMKAVRHFGVYGIDEAEKVIKRDAPLVWRALGGRPGWEHLCDMEHDQRTVYRAQFTKAYAELREIEERDRRLPESLRPRINDTPVAGLPEPTPELKALPAPPQPTSEQVEAAELRLKVFRDAPEPGPIDEREIEANRQRQIEVARRMAGKA